MTETLTFLFSDIVDSSRLWDEHPDAMRLALVVHNEILRTAVDENSGSIVKDRGDGFLAVFGGAPQAIEAAVQIQRRLSDAEWQQPIDALAVRIGMHSGTAEARDGDYFGPDVNRAARLEAAAHGGQVIISEATRALTLESLPGRVDLRDLGYHTLRGLARPERLYQLVADGIPEDFPAPRTVAGGRTGFPSFATSFVGRSDEITDLSDQLRDPGVRVVTLLGPGGIGKTRLATETAAIVASDFAGGGAFIDLVQITEPDGIPLAIATAIGAHPEGSVPVIDIVVSEISNPTLLVFDNFEHVIGGSPIVADLVARCDMVTLLVTSRAPLRIRGEIIHQMEPLAVDSSNGEAPAAVSLFVDRASDHGVTIDSDGAEGEAVRSIIRRVDGLPLAIELVAAMVRLLNVAELDRRLAESLAVMGSGAADLPERQQTIQSTIAWSVDALTPHQRVLFNRLSIFPAGASLDQVEAIAAFGLDGDALDLVSALVDHSLATVAGNLRGGTRFRQLTLLRDYAAEQLRADGDDDNTMSQLVDYYVGNAEAIGRAMEHDGSVLHEVESDYPNLAAAMEWSLGAGRAAEMVLVVYELWPVWFNGDRAAESAAWVERAGKLMESPELDWLEGLFAFETGDYATAADRFHQALNGFAASGHATGVALAQTFAGALADPAEGEAMLNKAVAHFEEQDRPFGRYTAMIFISVKAAESGDLARALDLRWQLLSDAEAIGYDLVIAWTHWNLATALLGLGRTDEAAEQNALAFVPFAELRYHEGIGSTAEVVAIVEVNQGRAERGVLIHGACEAIWDRLGVQVWWEIVPLIADAMSTARRQLGDDEYERLEAEGRSMSVDQLVELVDAD